MAPLPVLDAVKEVQQYINTHRVLIFSKTTCPFCSKVKELFRSLDINYYAVEMDLLDNGQDLHEEVKVLTGQKTVPCVFINGHLVGGCDKTVTLHSEGRLLSVIGTIITDEIPDSDITYDFDLIVIGGGSGGLAAAKAAANLGKKVAVFDFIVPTPKGVTWGLGGTCVNVGCIPKKLMHQASLLGLAIADAKKFGWEIPNEVNHNWMVMKNAIQHHIASLNWNYRVQLRDKQVQYFNSFAEFIEPNKVRHVNGRGKEDFATARHFIIASGLRPKYLDIPGDKEYCITSDDLFSLPYCPGKTLVVGASYVALECGGFLAGIGLDVSIIVRSILLRGFDQDMAVRVGKYMEEHGAKFIYESVPTKIEQIEPGTPGLLRVTSMSNSGEEIVDEYNTVILAIGRNACTFNIGLDKAGVYYDLNTGKIPSFNEQTNIPHIYAVGDVLENRPELTPVAIQAGKLLARRLYGGSNIQCDYINVATTVFTPLEYGCVGYSEEDAIEHFGDDNLEIYHSYFWPLEFTVPKRTENDCYAKLICLKSKNNQVIGLHILGPNAGEITQGFALAVKLGATFEDFRNVIGIHPTCAEIFTTMEVTKASGKLSANTGC